MVRSYSTLVNHIWMLMLLLGSHSAWGSIPKTHTGFIANLGQWDNPSSFLINLNGVQVFAEQHAIQYFFENPQDVTDYFSHATNPHLFKSQRIRQHAIRLNFNHTSSTTKINGTKPYKHHYNFFQGNDASRWKSEVPVFEQLVYENLYQGVNMKLYTNEEGSLKYDLVVAPEVSPEIINFSYVGADRIRLIKGNLEITTSVGTFTEVKPYAYQWIKGNKVDIPCSFVLRKNTVSFELGDYNKNYELIIDPLLIFSTYSGSSVDNFGHTATYDNSGNLYAAGIARNATTFPNGRYPVTAGAFQTIWGGGGNGSQSWPLQDFPTDISISKYTNDGSQLIYATYLGGNRNEYPISLVVDNYEQLVVLGATLSSNFPTKNGCIQSIKSDSFDITVTRFTANGSALVGSTYLGGNGIDGINVADTLRMNYADEFRGEVQVGSNGQIWLVSSTTSSNLSTTAGAYQSSKSGAQDGIIYKLDSALTQVLACSYFGGIRNDALYSLDIFANGDIVVAGGTQTTDFSTSLGYFSATYHGGISDALVAKFNSSLTNVLGLRYWGSAQYDQAHFVKLDNAQQVTVMGQAFDSVFATPGVYRNRLGSLFISKFTGTLGQVILSTQLGNNTASNAISPSAFMVDVCGRIYGSAWGGIVNFYSRYRTLNPTGFSSSTIGLPLTSGAYQTNTDGDDFYLFVLSANADSLTYATFFGEPGGSDHVDGGTSRFDKRGIVYQSACASCAYGTSGAFPTTASSYSPQNKSPRCSNASFKFDFRQSNVLIADFNILPKNACGNKRIQFQNNSGNAAKSYWYINNVLVDSSYHYADSFSSTGSYTVKLVVKNNNTCNSADSIQKTFTVTGSNQASFSVTQDSCGPQVFLSGNVSNSSNQPIKYLWLFGDGDTNTVSLKPTHQYATDGNYTLKLIANPGDVCADTAIKTIAYKGDGKRLTVSFLPFDSLRCEPTLIEFRENGENGINYSWYVNNQLKSTLKNGFDTITFAGAFTVKLVVEDSTTCEKRDTLERKYWIFKELYPQFDAAIDSCSLGATFLNKTPGIVSDSVPYWWSFGDGNFSNLVQPFHLYADTGTYRVKLVLNKGLPCETFIEKDIRIDSNYRALKAQFLIPKTYCLPGVLSANNTSINAQKWFWHVNGQLKDSLTFSYADTLSTSGDYTIMLVTYNPSTCLVYDTLVKTTTVFSGGKANFLLKRDSCSAQIIIKNLSTQTDVGTAYLWDFGDESSSTDANPTHSYNSDSTYLVTLILNPNTPCADTATQSINYKTNSHLLEASIWVSDSLLCLPQALQATATTVNGKSFQWYLNQIPVANTLNYTDTLKTAGTYHLLFVVKDSATCKQADSVSVTLEVADGAKPSFVMQRDSCSLKAVFQNTTPQTAAAFVWRFGDGDSSQEYSPVHEYKQTDTYTIQLVYGLGTFCADTATQVHFIDGDSSQQLFIPNVFTPNSDGQNDCFYVTGVNNKCDIYKIIVYNRWGNVVYENTDGSFCWYGKSQNGEDLPQGVYYYIITLRKPNGYKTDQHGTITLMRE